MCSSCFAGHCLVVTVTEASAFIKLSKLLTDNDLSVVSSPSDIIQIYQVLNNAATERITEHLSYACAVTCFHVICCHQSLNVFCVIRTEWSSVRSIIQCRFLNLDCEVLLRIFPVLLWTHEFLVSNCVYLSARLQTMLFDLLSQLQILMILTHTSDTVHFSVQTCWSVKHYF